MIKKDLVRLMIVTISLSMLGKKVYSQWEVGSQLTAGVALPEPSKYTVLYHFLYLAIIPIAILFLFFYLFYLFFKKSKDELVRNRSRKILKFVKLFFILFILNIMAIATLYTLFNLELIPQYGW